jgi:prefoldin alpha subunit
MRTQTRKEAQTHYNSKVSYVQQNLDKLQETIERKQQNQISVRDVLEMKIQQEVQQQQKQQGGK